MSAPAFSVVVPAYNAERTLADTLRSIAAQTFTDYEVIVVDDGSADATATVAERLVPRGSVHQQANRGLPGARNAGIRRARGRWIALLDADDLWLPGYLARMHALLTAAGDAAGFAYCDAWIYDDRRRRVARRSAFEWYRPAVVPTEPDAFYRALLHDNFVWVSACVPRAVVEEVGGFDERLRASEDWNLWLRIAATGRVGVGTTDRLGLYRHSDGQMHTDTERMLRGQRDCMRGVLESDALRGELRRATEDRARRTEAVLAAGGTDPAWRRAVRPFVDPFRGVKDFRLRTPPELRDAFPELFGRQQSSDGPGG